MRAPPSVIWLFLSKLCYECSIFNIRVKTDFSLSNNLKYFFPFSFPAVSHLLCISRILCRSPILS